MAETVGSVVEYTRDHTNTLMWGAIAVIALLLLVAGYFIWRGQRSVGAAEALAEAMAVEEDPATARERFQKVLDRYPRGPAGDVARLYLAGFAAAEDDADKARELWQAAAQAGGDTALGQQARLNLWELERSQGRHQELAEEIRALLAEEVPQLPRDQLLYQLGLTLEGGGDEVAARDAYLRLVDEHPESILVGIAQQRADRLDGAG